MNFIRKTIINVCFLVPLLLQQSIAQDKSTQLHLDVVTTHSPSTQEVKATILAPIFNVSMPIAENLLFSGSVGVSYLSLQREGWESQSSLDLSNVLLGVSYSIQQAEIQHKVGGYIAAPTAFYTDDNIDAKKRTEFNYTAVMSATGWRSPYQWLMNSLPFIVEYEAKWQFVPSMYLCYNIQPAYILATNSRPSGFSVANNLEYRYQMEHFMAGIGVSHYASGINLENNDYNQTAVHGFLTIPVHQILVALRTSVNMDAPYGITYNPPKTNWGITLGISTSL